MRQVRQEPLRASLAPLLGSEQSAAAMVEVARWLDERADLLRRGPGGLAGAMSGSACRTVAEVLRGEAGVA